MLHRIWKRIRFCLCRMGMIMRKTAISRQRKNTKVWMIIPAGEEIRSMWRQPAFCCTCNVFKWNHVWCKQTVLLYLWFLFTAKVHFCTDTDVSCGEAGVSHPADQGWPGRPDTLLTVVDIINISSVKPLQVWPKKDNQKVAALNKS